MSTSDRRRVALLAEYALAKYLADYGDTLWPEERQQLQGARRFLSKEAED